MKAKMPANVFFNLPEVVAQQNIQKVSRHGSKEHQAAFYEIKRICAIHLGAAFAEDYFEEYDLD